MRTLSRKQFTYAIAACAMALTMGYDAAIAKTYKLRYSDLGPPRGPRAEAMKWWADEIKKQTDGQVEIEFFWSQALVKGKETMKAVGSGLVDLGSILGVYTPADVPIWNLANAPFGGRDAWVGMMTWQQMRKELPELRKETEKKNVVILSNFTTGPVDILSKEPVLKLEDIKGKKFRATGGWGSLLKRLGAVPVRIGMGELYQALDKGTVDATINYIYAVKAYKHYEVSGHLTEIQMGQVLGYGIGINKRTWQKMPKDIRDKIQAASDELINQYARRLIDNTNNSRKEMQEGIDGKKVTFHVLPDEERDRWRKESEYFVAEWSEKMKKKGVDAEKIVATMKEIRAKYEAELKEKGYPWTR